ncbi:MULTISPECIES: DUF3048 domain-containing protein [Streptomyces]|uniref:DUF3048 domain-containing protein n=1 Tax=Streptomyces solicathayae TaxID=3081768 RepID=A0ABZ0M1Z0_9ACTN|nr:DUF3048 domain-containing protein [Streptomyces sp. HUAS YS2]WOX25714.1 DUF3048 domain-containing protein [Streptomyces sp. HUAS YS2]
MAGARGPRRPGAIPIAVLCAMTVAGLYGCSSKDEEPPPAPSPTTPPAVSPPAATGRSPFTGLPAEPAPVLAVKIDNVQAARPATGLGTADLVYVEQVEGGVTRLLAVYSDHLPDRVGPVRSARESDIALLRPFGRPALAYSGAQSALNPLLRAAPLHLVSEGSDPAAFLRSGSRPAPHNLYVLPARALAAAPDATDARDIGFRFGSAPADGTPVNSTSVRFPAARYTFTWSAPDEAWRVAMDGRTATSTDTGPLTPETVVIQYVTVRPSAFHDRFGSVSPYTETVGSGKALVLRDGRSHEARWNRASAGSRVAYTTPDGTPLNFARGQVWVVLAPR